MVEIIKRDEKREAFDAEKIRKAISKAMEEAKAPMEENRDKIDALVDEVKEIAEEKGEMHSERVREMVLKRLDEIEPGASEAWRKFDETKKKLS